MINTVQGVQLPPVLPSEGSRLDFQESSEQASSQRSVRERESENTRQVERRNERNREPNRPDFSQVQSELQKLLPTNTYAKINVDSSTRKLVVRIVDSRTDEIVRQLPSEESLKLAQLLAGRLEQGSVTDSKA
jgi:flagellar protein FlaG